MLEEIIKEYAAYFRLDVSSGFQTVQNVIDNMLTRLDELTSVLQMIKLKNSDCNAEATEEISRYRSEITTLSKKVATLNEVILKLQSNMDLLEKQVEKAEIDFGVNNDNKIRSFLKPFLMRSKPVSQESNVTITPPDKINFGSVLANFGTNQSH